MHEPSIRHQMVGSAARASRHEINLGIRFLPTGSAGVIHRVREVQLVVIDIWNLGCFSALMKFLRALTFLVLWISTLRTPSDATEYT
ncbi:hypothetical protein SCLCIDRAFT_588920 [Scleroderma citrinum Foug A]|uniref:Uncharacterized protein n=1 Tax=Scleroderma citrinum Foug A TaxID=1036808 RepID=A0A0C3D6H0_9AGAM|nr:hypothetical protein SCLCIDRAFT_588920 [Scleroderma citrinum Foug A]